MADLCKEVFDYVRKKCADVADLLAVDVHRDRRDFYVFLFFPQRKVVLKQCNVLAAIQMLGDDVKISKITYNDPVSSDMSPVQDPDSVILKMFGFRYGEFCLITYMDRQHFSSAQSCYFKKILHFYDQKISEQEEQWWLEEEKEHVFHPRLERRYSKKVPDGIFHNVDLDVPFEMDLGGHISQSHAPVQSVLPVAKNSVRRVRTKAGDPCYAFDVKAGSQTFRGLVSSHAFRFDKGAGHKKNPDIHLHNIERYVLKLLEIHATEAIGPFILYINLMRKQKSASTTFVTKNCDKIAKLLCDRFKMRNVEEVRNAIKETFNGCSKKKEKKRERPVSRRF